MIKHRFILSAEDFKIFAAIPAETKLLKWERWWRPANWPELTMCFEEAIAIFTLLEKEWTLVADGYSAISTVHLDFLEEVGPGPNELDFRRMRAAQAAETRLVADACSRYLEHLRHASVKPEGDIHEFTRRVASLIDSLHTHARGNIEDDVNRLLRTAEEHGQFYSRQVTFRKASARHMTSEEIRKGIEFGNTMRKTYGNLFDLLTVIVRRRSQIAGLIIRLSDLVGSDLVPGLTCPPGVPFPAYTMEWGDVVVNVVEGLAWVEGGRPGESRPPTEDEKRVVEIVSQMLTERGLNPKAETRIPTREVDPKKAHEQREADKRPGPSKVRTIKFFATPPRYLREAVESILASPRKAHWVIGHWRNQPWGVRNSLRREKWIAPHIRGLGEASASAARVLAPKEEPKRGTPV